MSFQPSQVKTSSANQSDLRIGDLMADVKSASVVLMGYPDDEGIANNGGRTGAAEGPDQIRQILYRMTPFCGEASGLSFSDLGNLVTAGISLKERQKKVQDLAKENYKAGRRVLALGGGHDFGFPDTKAFCDSFERPIVINFDAHFDVRPTIDGRITSGTGFFQLLEETKGVEFYQIGQQRHCNSQDHYNWCTERGVKTLFADTILDLGQPPEVAILQFLEPVLLKRRNVFISLDIDVFASHEAPGCSQSWPWGIPSLALKRVFDILYTRWDVKGLGIYEVAPKLDYGLQTSRLAALFAHQYLTHYGV